MFKQEQGYSYTSIQIFEYKNFKLLKAFKTFSKRFH